ncbi:preprotein translocase subunit SecA [Labilibaculum sp. A4]|uniref:preprotein translocase subunit SecA n=1 Tax=Labilibaculum euxinus TaxID=2686357 RepID=UPI000F61AAF3|nr:preprotein translocase subunit SecA [Labilibaculum euxinus]MDQ1770320.1 preprotein translocase subunit SecA [Labilibaculum euxinus]MWN75461.1 preprotein translocase subunit SecA [Labilibaculum euxinus]
MGFIDSTLGKLFGNKSDRDLKELSPYLGRIKAEYDRITTLSNDDLRGESVKLKQRIQDFIQAEKDEIQSLKDKIDVGELSINEREEIYDQIDGIEKKIDDKIEEVLEEILPTAFAVVKDTARRFTENTELEVTASKFDRDLAPYYDNIQIDGDTAVYFNSWVAGGTEITWNMIHYDVQLIGGTVLHQGKIAEMATGEGKTLVATLPVFLNALTGRGVHVITVNDYLAKRDSEWMGPLYQFHGLSVDCIDKHSPNSDARRKAYACDITFGTNNEFGFDYLRDNMATNPKDLVQRRHNYSIVDEVDSVLVDDARTPLIISGPIPRGEHQQFDDLKPKVQKLVKAQNDLVMKIFTDSKKLLNSEDKKDLEEGAKLLLRTYKGLPKMKPLIKFLSEQGNKANLLKTENFYMQENNKNMHIITDELYFVIDEKHNSIELTDKGIDLISSDVEDSGFFVLPDIGSEVAVIEKSDLSDEEKVARKDEMIQAYSVRSERVHTINQLLKAYTLFEKDVEYVMMDGKVKIVDEQTGRIMEGRRYSDGLHQAIEAKENVKVEAATQTFATITLQNYFRMYNKLAGMTGTAETEAGELWDIYKLEVVVIPTNRPICRDDREDLVYKTKREKYSAVIDEIVDLVNAGRPVLVGTTSVEISELLGRMLKIKGIKHNVLNAKLHQREADIVAEAGQSGTVTIATNMAGRGTDIKLSDEVKAAGGLAIIGTERHDSRRVDRQLRGRAGRQGDIGSSQFFVSLEDDLMRLFSSDRIVKLMDRMGLKEGEVIQHSMITKSIERAQKKVEENNFGIRKRLLEYDDVMNSQREVIYKRRRHALFGERIQVDIANMMYDISELIANEYHGGDFEEFKMDLLRTFSTESPVSEEEFMKEKPEEITEKIYAVVLDNYKRKVEAISKQAYPVIKNVYESKAEIYENIVVPFSDGSKMFQVVTNLKKAYESKAEDLVRSFEKVSILATIDDAWKEHLREMDDLKQSVQNASYEQKDPLLIYKFESFNLFKTMIETINKSVVSSLMKGHIPLSDPEDVRKAEERKRTDLSNLKTTKEEVGGGRERPEPKKQEPVRVAQKVGRNEPCPCGSGKKFKQCHGKGVPA